MFIWAKTLHKVFSRGITYPIAELASGTLSTSGWFLRLGTSFHILRDEKSDTDFLPASCQKVNQNFWGIRMSMQAHICYQQQKDLDWFFFFFFGLALVIMTHQRFVSLLKVTFLFPSLLFLFNSTFWVELHSARMCGSILRKVFI